MFCGAPFEIKEKVPLNLKNDFIGVYAHKNKYTDIFTKRNLQRAVFEKYIYESGILVRTALVKQK